MNEFYLKVYEIVRQIPKGRVTTYGAIAKCLGATRSARLVGYAMNLSHRYDPTLPAHRVVNRNGLLTGKHHFETPDRMQKLLESEGIIVKNNQIQNFENVFWNPCQ
ncbi:MAG: methylated-DNA--protein-cysteine methyltransferase [Bacteroidia bacterium]|nr:MAG: methylated-DNA--protein-cysteine methyltransferase [Bacteroidia bacterium]